MQKITTFLMFKEGAGEAMEFYTSIFKNSRITSRMSAQTISIGNTGGTDHQSFDAIGLPGFQFIQDEIEYNQRTHHSNMDVFDRIQGDDMKQMAIILAAFVYQSAMMDDKMPKKNNAPR